MGLLDNLGASFGNMTSDPRQMGLLMAAAQMMAQSGPSNRPVGLGEIMGGGLSTFLNTKNTMQQQQADAQEREQAQQYRGMQMQGMEQQQQAAKAALQRAQALQAHMAKREQGSAPTVPQQDGDSQIGSTLNPMQQLPQQGQENPYQRHMSMADHLRAGGFEAEANEYEDRALKFAPKVKNWQEVRVGNSVLMAPFFEDGTSGKPMPLEVARKLEFRDGGGTNDGFDPYTGQRKVSQQKTQSPDSIASNFLTMRGQNMTDARQREFNANQVEANNIARGEKRATDEMTRSSQVASFDTMLGTLDRLGQHPGLSRSVGMYGAFPTMPGSDSANFQAELETFQSQAFIPMVAQLKGMGALSDAEGRKLTAAVGALNPKMGEQAFRASISRIKADMEQARARVSNFGKQPSTPYRPTQAPGGFQFLGFE